MISFSNNPQTVGLLSGSFYNIRAVSCTRSGSVFAGRGGGSLFIIISNTPAN